MATWWKQLQPYLLILSLIAILGLGRELYNRDDHLNRITWGNAVGRVWQHVSWSENSVVPASDGRLGAGSDTGILTALEDLEAMESLPHYSQRIAFDDMQTLRQFLRYASQAYQTAVKEQSEQGAVSSDSVRRLTKVREGLYFILTHNQRTNELKSSRNPWDHAGWRAVWADIARGLREMEFVPLPE